MNSTNTLFSETWALLQEFTVRGEGQTHVDGLSLFYNLMACQLNTKRNFSLVAIVPGKFKSLKLHSAWILKKSWGIGLHGIKRQDLVRIASNNICYDGVGALIPRIVIGEDDRVCLHRDVHWYECWGFSRSWCCSMALGAWKHYLMRARC